MKNKSIGQWLAIHTVACLAAVSVGLFGVTGVMSAAMLPVIMIFLGLALFVEFRLIWQLSIGPDANKS